MVAPAGARAQTATAFTQKALCTADAKLDVGKFLVVAINDASLDLSKVMVDGSRIDNDKLHALVADAPSVILFEDQYLNAPNPYFKVVTRPDARGGGGDRCPATTRGLRDQMPELSASRDGRPAVRFGGVLTIRDLSMRVLSFAGQYPDQRALFKVAFGSRTVRLGESILCPDRLRSLPKTRWV
jgi:hypothetical protein